MVFIINKTLYLIANSNQQKRQGAMYRKTGSHTGRIGGRRFRDDFIVKDRSQTKMTRREIQVVEQEEDLRDKCSERTMSKIS